MQSQHQCEYCISCNTARLTTPSRARTSSAIQMTIPAIPKIRPQVAFALCIGRAGEAHDTQHNRNQCNDRLEKAGTVIEIGYTGHETQHNSDDPQHQAGDSYPASLRCGRRAIGCTIRRAVGRSRRCTRRRIAWRRGISGINIGSTLRAEPSAGTCFGTTAWTAHHRPPCLVSRRIATTRQRLYFATLQASIGAATPPRPIRPTRFDIPPGLYYHTLATILLACKWECDGGFGCHRKSGARRSETTEKAPKERHEKLQKRALV
jgi:hypothetical protein